MAMEDPPTYAGGDREEAPLRLRPPLLRFGFSSQRVAAFAARNADALSHLAWYLKEVDETRHEDMVHLGNKVYLDYAGAGLFTEAQIRAASGALLESLMANPHSSDATAKVMENVRTQMLKYFGVSRTTHSLIFTSGATHSLQLVGESLPWTTSCAFIYAKESHTSLVGLRQYARRGRAQCGIFAFQELSSLVDSTKAIEPLAAEQADCALSLGTQGSMNVLAFPGESNFDGQLADLRCIGALRTSRFRWRVLLDAAKLACIPGALALNRIPADFTVVSFYKMFGYPTGLGALIVRHDAAPLMAPTACLEMATGGTEGRTAYFGGGSVASISATSHFAVPRPSLTEWLERGTPNYCAIAALPSQVSFFERMAPAAIRRLHVLSVTRDAYLQMRQLIHSSGKPLCTVLGRHAEKQWMQVQGPTIAFTMSYPDGSPIPYGLVTALAGERNIVLRAGCHCNAGSCQQHLHLSDADVRQFHAAGKVCGDDLGLIDGRHVGVLRISFGIFSTLADVRRWLEFLTSEFLDRKVDALANASMTAHTAGSQSTISLAATIPSRPQECSSGRIVQLSVYPIKGCGPLRVKRWPMDAASGSLFMDRRWCLVPEPSSSSTATAERRRYKPVSAKQAPRLTQVQLSLVRYPAAWQDAGSEVGVTERLALELSCKGREESLLLPLSQTDEAQLKIIDGWPHSFAEVLQVTNRKEVVFGHAAAAEWFEHVLLLPRLRLLEASATAGTGEAPSAATHFANTPSTLLMVSTASLQEFGRVCGLAVPSDRFRANIEVDFEQPYAEAKWPVGWAVKAGALQLEAAGRCIRCQAVDIDPEDGSATGPSLLAALATSQPMQGSGPTFGVLLRPHDWRDKNIKPLARSTLAIADLVSAQLPDL
mmetsp:Transcript_5023/g.11152  ORF Transcript_5023/g.11152 Transcript_5023/m.11152 type:complete len:882 (+) Transcript_5023:70-2715(+)